MLKLCNAIRVQFIETLDSLIETSIKQGTSYTDVRQGRVVNKNIIAQNGKIVDERNCINSGYGIRMLSEGIVTFISTPRIRFAEKEIKKAISVSKLLTNWKKGISELADAPVADSSIVKKPKINWVDFEN